MKVLAVRLDSDGDVLLTGPAIRALAAGAERLDLLVSGAGAAAARLLPGVDDVLVFDAPWTGFRPPPVDPAAIASLIERLSVGRYDLAVVFTSFHQSPLPMALLARMAGIARVVADCEDYPGSLLDVRHHRRDGHEVEAALELAAAAGAQLPPGDDGRLALEPSAIHPLTIEPLSIEPGATPLAAPESVSAVVPGRPFVVVHPGASVPSRAMSAEHAREVVAALVADGWEVRVSGGPAERALTAQVTVPGAVDLGGRTTLAQLAGVLREAACVVVGNTGPAHLAAAVGTPVVSLFSPVVAAARWAPYGVPTVLLGDQRAPCRETRARQCPVAGHPCLNGVAAATVVASVARLARRTLDLTPGGVA
jgi:heptosyltransferase-3